MGLCEFGCFELADLHCSYVFGAFFLFCCHFERLFSTRSLGKKTVSAIDVSIDGVGSILNFHLDFYLRLSALAGQLRLRFPMASHLRLSFHIGFGDVYRSTGNDYILSMGLLLCMPFGVRAICRACHHVRNRRGFVLDLNLVCMTKCHLHKPFGL